ncbi:MAG: NAD(P)-dependent oxidoreductase [Planctomycetota bacterium]|nr:NAD(P)-dependent oxidoreductase [Planctomycetota bacterium]
MKKMLVTGTEGEVGSALLPQLAKCFDATGFDIKPHAGTQKTVQGDLLNYDDIAGAAEGMDAIVHMAALLCRPEQDLSIDLNVKATANVLQAAVDKGVKRVVYCSTVWASGHGATEPYLPIDEAVPCKPVCMYGQTKWLGELMTQWYGRMHGLETVIIRFCGYHHVTGYAADGTIDWARADVPALFERCLNAGHKLMNPVDLGEAFGLAANKPGISGQRFIVGVNTPYVASDAAGLRSMPAAVHERYYPGVPALLETIGLPIPSMPYFFSHQKARTGLGFRCQHDLGDLARLYRQWRGIP